MVYDENFECLPYTSFKHLKKPRKNKNRKKQRSRRKERVQTLAKKRARFVKYTQNQEENYLAGEALQSVLEDYKSWLVEWMDRPRPALTRKFCFSQASIPFTVYEKQCACFCGDEDCTSLKNLGCGHWMHPECLENVLCTMNHDGKDISSATCPLCKYSLDKMRTDFHYNKIDLEAERLFEAELLAAIQASLPSFDSEHLPKRSVTDRNTSIFADDFTTVKLKIAPGVGILVTKYERRGRKVFGKTPGGWALLQDGDIYFTQS